MCNKLSRPYGRYEGTRTKDKLWFTYANSRGITLLELLITIAVSVILLGAMFLSFVIGLRRWEEASINSLLTRNALFSLDKITREIRQATNLYEAEANKLTIDVDINPLDSNTSPERVSYYLDSLDNTLLMRKVWGGGGSPDKIRVLTNNVHSLEFTYRDGNNNTLSFPVTISEVRLIEIKLVLRESGREFSLSNSAYLRNIQ
ncbi:MAG: hypothetical protein GXO71_00620 [Caldiserica bacterium]|nr:hypothetical protein [Caldisericota bacterium]